MSDLTKPYVPSHTDPTQVLLPENRTKLETDLVITQARTTDVQVPYRDLFDPWKTREDFLPWLASNWSVDLWYEDWPDTTKRSIIANIVRLKRQKGTLAGIEAYMAYVNGTVIKAVTPPATAFYRGALTDEQRLAFVNSLPNIEIQDYQARRTPPAHRAFMNDTGNTRRKKSFYGHDFMQSSAGPELYGRKAFFVDPLHPEIPPAQVTYTSFVDPITAQQVEQVFISFSNSKRTFMGHGFMKSTTTPGKYRCFMQNTRAGQNMLSVVLNSNASLQYASFNGFTTYNVNPQTIFQKSVLKSRAVYSRGNCFYGHCFMRQTRAPSLIYDRISIFDPSRVPVENKAHSFYGRSRFGIAPYNAELTVKVPMFRGRYRRNNFYGRGSYMKSWDAEPLYRVLDAIRVAKSKRDRILVQPQTHQIVRLGSHTHLGSFKLGETISTVL